MRVSSFVLAYINCAPLLDLLSEHTHARTQTHTNTHTHTHFKLPSLLSLICSRNILIFRFLINHCDREGPHYTWVQELPTFFLLPCLFITSPLICTLSLPPSGIDTWLLISAGERQQQPCPPGVFLTLPNWHVHHDTTVGLCALLTATKDL